jgi:hypothetical protein
MLFYNKSVWAAHHWTVPTADLKRLEKQQVPIAFFAPRGGFYKVPAEAAAYRYSFHIAPLLKPL